MMITTLEKLDEAHRKHVWSLAKKRLDNWRWQINPNDIGWILTDEIESRILGRSRRVFNRLQRLEDERAEREWRASQAMSLTPKA